MQPCYACVSVVGQGIRAPLLCGHACFAHAHAFVFARDRDEKLCVIKNIFGVRLNPGCGSYCWIPSIPRIFHVHHPSLPSCRPVRREI